MALVRVRDGLGVADTDFHAHVPDVGPAWARTFSSPPGVAAPISGGRVVFPSASQIYGFAAGGAGDPRSPNYAIEASFGKDVVASPNGRVGIIARAASLTEIDADAAIYLDWWCINAAGSGWQLSGPGFATITGDNGAADVAGNRVLRLELAGSTVRAYFGAALVATVTTTRLDGIVGVHRLGAQQSYLNDFELRELDNPIRGVA